MTKNDYIDKLLVQIRKNLPIPPPHGRYDKNYKTIRVTYDFGSGVIPKVKIIASPAQWFTFSNDLDQITFEAIEPYLSKRLPKKTRTDLKKYSRTWPDHFIGDMFACIQCANFYNPKYPPATKARGGSPYGLNRLQMNEIRNTARHLYIYIQCNNKRPAEQQPILLDMLFEVYGLSNSDMQDVVIATMLIVEKAFDFQVDSSAYKADPRDTFYKKYIAYRPFSQIKKSQRIISGRSPFLTKIFARLRDHQV